MQVDHTVVRSHPASQPIERRHLAWVKQRALGYTPGRSGGTGGALMMPRSFRGCHSDHRSPRALLRYRRYRRRVGAMRSPIRVGSEEAVTATVLDVPNGVGEGLN